MDKINFTMCSMTNQQLSFLPFSAASPRAMSTAKVLHRGWRELKDEKLTQHNRNTTSSAVIVDVSFRHQVIAVTLEHKNRSILERTPCILDSLFKFYGGAQEIPPVNIHQLSLYAKIHEEGVRKRFRRSISNQSESRTSEGDRCYVTDICSRCWLLANGGLMIQPSQTHPYDASEANEAKDMIWNSPFTVLRAIVILPVHSRAPDNSSRIQQHPTALKSLCDFLLSAQQPDIDESTTAAVIRAQDVTPYFYVLELLSRVPAPPVSLPTQTDSVLTLRPVGCVLQIDAVSIAAKRENESVCDGHFLPALPHRRLTLIFPPPDILLQTLSCTRDSMAKYSFLSQSMTARYRFARREFHRTVMGQPLQTKESFADIPSS